MKRSTGAKARAEPSSFAERGARLARKRPATRAPHASRAMTQTGDAPQPGNGEGQNRTGDTTIFSRVLYQLSYLAEAAR